MDSDGLLMVGSIVPRGTQASLYMYTGYMQDLRLFSRKLEEG